MTALLRFLLLLSAPGVDGGEEQEVAAPEAGGSTYPAADIFRVPHPPARHHVTLGLVQIDQGAVFRGARDERVVELTYGWTPGVRRWQQVELGGGLRVTSQRERVAHPGEVFVRARLEGRFGSFSWRPAIGPELGLSGLLVPAPRRDGFPEDVDDVEARRLSPLYLSVDLAPLRFHYRGLTLSAMELSIGAPLFPSGTALRTELGFVSLGYSL